VRVSGVKRILPEREVCPRCGGFNARIIGRFDGFRVLYLRCDDCCRTAITKT
jgi:hypothetical protein